MENEEKKQPKVNNEDLNELAGKLFELFEEKRSAKDTEVAEKKKAIVETEPEPEKPKAKKLTKDEKIAEFFKALLTGDREKIQPLSEGTAGNGGYLVPEEFATEFIADRRDLVQIRRLSRVINITTDTFHLPRNVARPKVYVANELATKSTTSAEWDEITLTPYTIGAIASLSNQVIADASIGGNIINVMRELMTRAIAEKEDELFVNGTGSSQPTGLTTYTSVPTVDAGGALDGDDLISIYYKLPQGYRRSAVWIMNSRTIANVRSLKDTTNRYIFDQTLNEDGFPTLLGKSVVEQNDLTSDTILFGDLGTGYWIADREGISVAVSDTATVASYSAFERNLTHIRVEERVDAELADTHALARITNTGIS